MKVDSNYGTRYKCWQHGPSHSFCDLGPEFHLTKCVRINCCLIPLSTNTVTHTLLYLTLAGLSPPEIKHTNTPHTTPEDPHRWVSEVKILPPKRGKNKIGESVHPSSTINYTCTGYCVPIRSCWKYIWHITHNHDLTGYVYKAKMSRVNFPFKSLDLCRRHIILNMTN